jgi:hypothetical protein
LTYRDYPSKVFSVSRGRETPHEVFLDDTAAIFERAIDGNEYDPFDASPF